MSSILVRSLLSPLKLAPSSYSKVHVLLSPSLSDSPPSSSSNAPSNTAFLPPSALPALVEQCPSLHSGSFHPSAHLPSGHLQTVYSTLADTVEEDAVHYFRRVLMLPDGGLISLDISEAQDGQERADCPTVVIAHGLTGGSQESYVRHCVKQLTQHSSAFRCVVVNFRGCANTPVTSSQLYSASKTSDVRTAVLFLRSVYPRSPLVGLGFSLGANVMAKYLAEEGNETPLLGGIVCAAPFDLKKGSDLMEQNTFRRHVYSRAMNANLTRLASRHASTLALDEELHEALDRLLDDECGQAHVESRGELAGSSKKTLKFVDDILVRLAGGHRKPYGEFPFDSSDAYYNYGGALNFLHGLQRPMLALNADDDPIVAADSVKGLRAIMGYGEKQDKDRPTTEYVVLATTQGGGHLGWWQGGVRSTVRWLATPVVEFVHALVEASKKRSSSFEHDLRKTKEESVLIELTPIDMLPPYQTPKERNGVADNGVAKKEVTVDPKFGASGQGARLPWLRTHLLREAKAPLHPSMARQGWTEGEPKNTADFSLNDESAQQQQHKQYPGRCAFEATMVVDVDRPEVGYVELPAWTRVGGAGEHFQGGKQMAGMYDDDTDGNKLIAGL